MLVIAEVEVSESAVGHRVWLPELCDGPFPYVTGPQDAPGFVADRLAEGATHLKILYDDGSASPMPMPSLDLATVRALVEAAHAAGMLTVAHVTTAVAAVDVAYQAVGERRRAFYVLNDAELDNLDQDQL